MCFLDGHGTMKQKYLNKIIPYVQVLIIHVYFQDLYENNDEFSWKEFINLLN
jgi:hypothetical protein